MGIYLSGSRIRRKGQRERKNNGFRILLFDAITVSFTVNSVTGKQIVEFIDADYNIDTIMIRRIFVER